MTDKEDHTTSESASESEKDPAFVKDIALAFTDALNAVQMKDLSI